MAVANSLVDRRPVWISSQLIIQCLQQQRFESIIVRYVDARVLPELSHHLTVRLIRVRLGAEPVAEGFRLLACHVSHELGTVLLQFI